MTTFTDTAVISCSTKRASITGGVRNAPATNLSGLKCTPLDPVDAELAQRAGLSTPIEVWQTFLQGDVDIQNGDILVVGSNEYPIRAVWNYANWDGLDTENDIWLWLILEEIKSS